MTPVFLKQLLLLNRLGPALVRSTNFHSRVDPGGGLERSREYTRVHCSARADRLDFPYTVPVFYLKTNGILPSLNGAKGHTNERDAYDDRFAFGAGIPPHGCDSTIDGET